ncbi:MAG: hypothetical protein BGP06_11140 [Rhizobiales bacterium 65-9]|nr:hypothetical protein [Hyphomicrobiales bacterium]OJY32959.1 MAG: hypothetical protein BGP06_11140 [Rhizobiales bacterium 65-9]
MRRMIWLSVLSAAIGWCGLATASAREVIPAEQRNPSWSAALPACEDPSVIGQVQSGFASRESSYWQSNLAIAGVDHVRTIAFRPWGADYIPRRYCVARAYMSDGRLRTVSYNIIERAGPIGLTWGVEWCVSGLDRLFYYAPDCKMARP